MPDDLADQIAAGEVVERPASAVKELVENAIDAEATRIRVELEEGGLRLLRVTDDGVGMIPDDAERCVLRHATSKIVSKEDLFAIGTLGFRGEALPSIASVSRFSLLTRARGTAEGTRVVIEGGRLVEVCAAGAPPGTEVTVRELFFNTPARLKFLKARSTELKHVVETIQRLAFAYPGIGFVLVHNGRSVLDLPPVTRPSDRVFAILGSKEAEGLFELEPAEQDGASCGGFFSMPTLSRRNNSGIWAFVNGRFVRDNTIMAAVRQGYQGMVDRGRSPIAILHISVPPSAVDVNVHPAKTEVRFHDSSAVFRAVRRSIANSLASAPWVPRAEGPDAGEEREVWRSGVTENARVPRDASNEPLTSQIALPVRSYTLHGPEWGSGRVTSEVPVSVSRTGFGEERRDAEPAPAQASTPSPDAGYFEGLHYVGCIHNAYLLASDGRGLVVVDQHAAHERITFERLRTGWRERRYSAQPLLVPRVLSLDATRAAVLADNLEFFAALGFEIEPFGGCDFALKSAPAVLRSGAHEAILIDAIDELGETGHSGRVDEAIDAVLLRMACHGSIRAGDRVGVDEVYRLFRELDQVDFGANCPHGRPVYFRMSLEELETRFERR